MATKPAKEKVLYCSFCGKSQHEAEKLIAGPSVYICNECIHLCNDIIGGEKVAPKVLSDAKLPTPSEIVAELDLHIIGQRTTKEALAVAAYHHYRRMAHRGKNKDGVEVQKSNVLLIGPTGSGKTHTVEKLAQLLGVPFAKVDLTSVTGAGWMGADVTDVLKSLLHSADGDVRKAEFGVILADEVDKLGIDNAPGASKGFGKMVQQAMLTMLDVEGANVEVTLQGSGPASKEVVTINTKNILFIFAGAFDGLEDVIAKRKSSGGRIGFSGTLTNGSGVSKELFHDVTPEDLIEFGFDSQFLGRLPVLAVLDELNEAMMSAILTQPKNSLFKQFAQKLAWDSAELTYDEDAIVEIAKMAMKNKSGARGLRTICERIFHSTFMTLPTLQKTEAKIARVHLTAQHVKDGTQPEFIRVDQKLLK